MYKLVYNDFAIEKIDIFTKSYRNSFIRLFEDSGLLMEKEIVDNYIKLWDRLHELIFENIDKNFSENIILWISKTDSGETFSTLTIKNFRLFVYYKELNDKQIRIINNVEIFKKS